MCKHINDQNSPTFPKLQTTFAPNTVASTVKQLTFSTTPPGGPKT